MKPATPLPWHFVQHNGDRPTLYRGKPSYQPAYVYSGDVRIFGFQHMPNDAAYIVHACNAYPKLVEALRELLLRCDGEEGVRADGSNIQTRQASSVLHELGEL